jgi:hypothetical protein
LPRSLPPAVAQLRLVRWLRLQPIQHMKAVKIIFAILAALWVLALVPKLLAGVSQSAGPFAFSHIMGSVAGILIASAISIILFRSAFRT